MIDREKDNQRQCGRISVACNKLYKEIGVAGGGPRYMNKRCLGNLKMENGVKTLIKLRYGNMETNT